MELGAKHMRVGRKGQPLTIDGELGETVREDATIWTFDGAELVIELEKVGIVLSVASYCYA